MNFLGKIRKWVFTVCLVFTAGASAPAVFAANIRLGPTNTGISVVKTSGSKPVTDSLYSYYSSTFSYSMNGAGSTDSAIRFSDNGIISFATGLVPTQSSYGTYTITGTNTGTGVLNSGSWSGTFTFTAIPANSFTFTPPVPTYTGTLQIDNPNYGNRPLSIYKFAVGSENGVLLDSWAAPPGNSTKIYSGFLQGEAFSVVTGDIQLGYHSFQGLEGGTPHDIILDILIPIDTKWMVTVLNSTGAAYCAQPLVFKHNGVVLATQTLLPGSRYDREAELSAGDVLELFVGGRLIKKIDVPTPLPDHVDSIVYFCPPCYPPDVDGDGDTTDENVISTMVDKDGTTRKYVKTGQVTLALQKDPITGETTTRKLWDGPDGDSAPTNSTLQISLDDLAAKIKKNDDERGEKDKDGIAGSGSAGVEGNAKAKKSGEGLLASAKSKAGETPTLGTGTSPSPSAVGGGNIWLVTIPGVNKVVDFNPLNSDLFMQFANFAFAAIAWLLTLWVSLQTLKKFYEFLSSALSTTQTFGCDGGISGGVVSVPVALIYAGGLVGMLIVFTSIYSLAVTVNGNWFSGVDFVTTLGGSNNGTPVMRAVFSVVSVILPLGHIGVTIIHIFMLHIFQNAALGVYGITKTFLPR